MPLQRMSHFDGIIFIEPAEHRIHHPGKGHVHLPFIIPGKITAQTVVYDLVQILFCEQFVSTRIRHLWSPPFASFSDLRYQI